LKNWNLLISAIYLVALGCGLPINVELPTVTKIYINYDKPPTPTFPQAPVNQLVIEGNNLSNVDAVSVRQSTGTRAQSFANKDFEIVSKTNTEIRVVGIDAIKLPGSQLLDLILSRAEGQSVYPIEFIPGADSIEDFMIQDGAVTRLKLAPEPGDNPSDGDVLVWDNGIPPAGAFKFEPQSGSGPGTGISFVNRGEGIFNFGTPINAPGGTISIDKDTTGDPTLFKIPYFTNTNQLVLDSTFNNTKLWFKGPNEISMYNDGILRFIDEGAPLDIMTLSPGGDVAVGKDLAVTGTSLTVAGTEVCQEDGTNCPNTLPGSISTITVTPPITGGGTGPSVNIGLDLNGVVSSITAGSTAILVDQPQGSVTVDIGFGGAASAPDLVQRWNNYLDNISLLTPVPNGVMIGATATSDWEVQSGIPLTQSLGLEIDVDVQRWDHDLDVISAFTHLNGQYMVSDGNDWTLRQTPFCAFGQVIKADSGIDFTCTDETFIFQLSETRWLDPVGAPGPNYVGFRAPPNIANSISWQLPDADGAPGTLLMTDGFGRLSWSPNVGGDVSGPPSSTQDHIATFADATGKVIQDSGLLITDVGDVKVSTTSPTTNDNTVALWDGNLSKTIKGSNLSYDGSDLTGPIIIESQAFRFRDTGGNTLNLFPGLTGLTTPYNLFFPPVGPANDQILRSDASGVLSWVTTPSTIGDVTGPATSIPNQIALYSDTNGEILKATNYTIPDVVGTMGQFLMSDGTTNVVWADVNAGNVVGPTPGSTQFAIPTYADTTGELLLDSNLIYNGGILSGATNINSPTFGLTAGGFQLNLSVNPSISSNYNLIFPALAPAASEILVSDGSGNFSWTALPTGTGDVTGPATSVLNGAAIYSDTLGKNIVSTTYSLPPGNGTPGQALVYTAPDTVDWVDVGNVRTADPSTDNNIPLWDGNNNKTLKDSNLNYTPAGVLSGPTSIESLQFTINGSTSGVLNLVAQSTFPDYTLTFPGIVPTENQILQTDAGGNLSWIPTPTGTGDVIGPGNGNSAANTIALFTDTTGVTIKATPYNIPDIDGAAGQVLQTDGSGNVTWEDANAGDVVGPNTVTADGNLAIYDGLTGKLIKDSLLNLADVGDVQGPAPTSTLNAVPIYDTTDGTSIGNSNLIYDGTTLSGPVNIDSQSFRINGSLSGVTTLIGTANITDYTLTLPPAGPSLTGNQILLSDNLGTLSWTDLPAGGDVSSSAPFTVNNLAYFSTADGKTIADAGMSKNDIVQSVAAGPGIQDSMAIFSDGTGRNINATPYTFPTIQGTNKQVLRLQGTGQLVWDDAGTGDVVGPLSSTDNHVAIFDGATGKLLKDTGLDVSSINTSLADVVGPAGSAPNRVALYLDASGKTLTETLYSLPTADGALNQVLMTNAAGVVSWQDTGTGDVVGPGSSQLNRIALYSDATGKALKETNYTIPDTVGTAGQFLMSDGSPNVVWSDVSVGNVVGPSLGSTQFAILLLDSTLLYNGGILSGASNVNSPNFGLTGGGFQLNLSVSPSLGSNYNLIFPANAPAASEILVSDGSGNFSWTPLPTGTGDVTGPLTSITNGAAIYSDATGKNIASTTYALPPGNGSTGQALIYSSPSTVTWEDVGNVKGPSPTSTLNAIPIYDAGDGSSIANSNLLYDGTSLSGAVNVNAQTLRLNGSTSGVLTLNIPPSLVSDYNLVFPGAAPPGANYILQSDALGNFNWLPTPTGTGDVIGPVTSTTDAVALFADGTGTSIKQTPYIIPTTNGTNGQVLTTNGAGVATWEDSGSGDVVGPAGSQLNRIALYSDATGKALKETDYTIPDTVGTAGQFLMSDGSPNVVWSDVSLGNVVGPTP
jgi:hypothetical protein